MLGMSKGLRRGLDPCFWRLPKEQDFRELGSQEGLLDKNQVCKSRLSPFPSSTHTLCSFLSTQSLQLLADVPSGLWGWPQAEQLSHGQGKCVFAGRESYWPDPACREQGNLPSHTNFCLLGLWVRHGHLFPSGHNPKCELGCLLLSQILNRVVLEQIIMMPEAFSHLSFEEVLCFLLCIQSYLHRRKREK